MSVTDRAVWFTPVSRVAGVVLATLLVLPATATAAEREITVGNDFFQPADVQIAVNDTVTWVFSQSGNHDIQSRPGEEETFDSDPGNPSPFHTAGFRFSHTFTRDSVAVDYVCSVHPSTMSGTVTVGAPPVDADPPAVTAADADVGRRRVAIDFALDEAAQVTLSLARAARPNRVLRTVNRQLGVGESTINLRRRGLRPGRYVARLSAVDDAGNQSEVARASFRLRRPRR
jgi:plastocyanin